MNRTRPIVATAVAVFAASLVTAGAARAEGDPPGTAVLSSGPAAGPGNVALLAATREAVVLSDRRGLVLERTDGTGSSVLASFGYRAAAAGSLVLYDDLADGGQRWVDTAGGATGATRTRWDAPAPTGGLILSQPRAGVARLSLQDARTGRKRVLADLPGVGSPAGLELAPGADRVVVSTTAPDDPFVVSVGYDRGDVTTYDLGDLVDATSADCVAPSATTVACGSYAGDRPVFTVPVTGGAFRTVATVPGRGGDIALSATAVGWLVSGADGRTRLQSVPVAGGDVTTAPRAGFYGGFVSDGVDLAVTLGTTAATYGVYRLSAATATPQRVASVDTATYSAYAVAVAPGGRLVFADNRTEDRPLWQRSIKRTAAGVAAVGETRLTADPAYPGLSASGARTGYLAGFTGDYHVISPLQATTVWPGSFREAGPVSGLRVLTFAPDGQTAVGNLVTGQATPLPGRGALWGDTYTYVDDSGALRRMRLTGDGAPVRLGPAHPDTTPSGPVVVWGDHVAVTRSGSDGATTVEVVDVAAGTRREGPGSPVTAAGAAGFVTRGSTGETLTRWDGRRSITVSGAELAVTATTMAWLGSDGRARVAPVPWSTPDVPRSLGNPAAPATLPARGTWTFDLPTSAPLTSCTVEIVRGATVVRSLSCDPTYRGGGDAVVRWDGRNDRGRLVPAATYTWRVVAANGDGALQRADGTSGPVTGSVAVTA